MAEVVNLITAERCTTGTTYLPKGAISILTHLLSYKRSGWMVEPGWISELEIGSGQGQSIKRFLPDLLRKFPQRKIALVLSDNDAYALSQAPREHHLIERISIELADARSIPKPDNSLDLVIASGLITQMVITSDIIQAFAEMVRIARVVCIMDFQIIDFNTKKIIDLQRIKEYMIRYNSTSIALDLPFGCILSATDPQIEAQLRILERQQQIIALREYFVAQREKIRIARHFNPNSVANWLVYEGFQRFGRAFGSVYLRDKLHYLTPSSQKALAGFVLICRRKLY